VDLKVREIIGFTPVSGTEMFHMEQICAMNISRPDPVEIPSGITRIPIHLFFRPDPVDLIRDNEDPHPSFLLKYGTSKFCRRKIQNYPLGQVSDIFPSSPRSSSEMIQPWMPGRGSGVKDSGTHGTEPMDSTDSIFQDQS
jgi:hypothetical protein